MSTIVFISSLDASEQSQWLISLRKKLVDETILLPDEVDDSDIDNIDIAIVADPDPAVLDKFPNLVWIQSLWAGVERLIDKKLLARVKVVRLIDPQLAKTMAEAVLAWTLYLQRNMPEYAQQQRLQQWQQRPSITSDELRISVLGAGNLGKASIKALTKLDYQVSCWSRTAKQLNGVNYYHGQDGLQDMLSKTDILINLLPLTKQTYHLLNTNLLSQLPMGAKLINFSRGAVIDTKALLRLLDNGHLSHAVLDVFEQEPLPQNDPLWCHPKITVLPHISAPTNIFTATDIVVSNITAYREKNVIPEAVNAELGY